MAASLSSSRPTQETRCRSPLFSYVKSAKRRPVRRGLMSEQDFQASESGARAGLPSKRDWRASPSPNGAQLAFPGIPFVAFADMRAVWCITHRAAAPSNARSAPKTTGSRRTAICRGHCLCCRGSCKELKWGPAGVFTPGSQWVDLRDAKSMAGKYFSQ